MLTHGVVGYILMGIGGDSADGNENVVTHGVVDYILMGTEVDPPEGNKNVRTHGVVAYILMGVGVNSSYGYKDVLTHGVVDSAWASLTRSSWASGLTQPIATRMWSPTGLLTQPGHR